MEQRQRLESGHLEGQTALVTGSSRGIGAAVARTFAEHGARVVLHGRDESALKTLEGEISRRGGHAMYVLAELTKFSDIEVMRQKVENTFGAVDILVANAGGSFTTPAPLEKIPEDGWHASVEGNLTATFLTLKSFLPGMKERKHGVIITVSSSAGRRPNEHSPIPYPAAKAGIQILTQHVAAEAGKYGIRVNCIAPETILTEKNLGWISKEQQESLKQFHPLKRLGTPEDVADAALFLASDEASWITGHILDISGGAVMV